MDTQHPSQQEHTQQSGFVSWLRDVRPLYPILAIWGIEWIAQAGLIFLEKYNDTSSEKMIAFGVAAVLSALLFGNCLLRSKGMLRRRLDRIALVCTPLLLFAAIPWWLQRIGAFGDVYSPVVHALLLAVLLVLAGLSVSRPLAILGLWLLLASFVISSQFLGYAGIVLSGFGGLALIAAAWHLRGLAKRLQ